MHLSKKKKKAGVVANTYNSALKRLRQEAYQLHDSVGYKVRPCLGLVEWLKRENTAQQV
jgi:hypothetical protein